MSIAVLAQVYSEARRLAIAGSVVARGDFRLKKLVAPLEAAGKQAPVFAKVAECAKAVIDGPEDSSAEALLELTSLVNAVLYTQGETGLAGKVEPIETSDLGGAATQTSARVLKPLLEALSSTGSGRLELVRDAHTRGLFRDLRLVKPALGAIDDSYPEIADLITEKVLPMYGKAILPELRSKYDPKGNKGHARRLTLMHAIDKADTRELVKAALDGGSKEVKVAAISCLGADAEDLAFLIEQASAKAQDVRAAAYHALAAIDDPAAVAVLEKAITGKDLEAAARAIAASHSSRLPNSLVAEIKKVLVELPKQKDKKLVSEAARRLVTLIGALPAVAHSAADALTLDLFSRRAELAAVKGADQSGSDVVEAVIRRMEDGPNALQTTLAAAHADLDGDSLGAAFVAARRTNSAAKVFEMFSPYILAAVGKKPGKKRDAILDALGADYIRYYWTPDTASPKLDDRWLEVGIKAEHLGLVYIAGRPGHAGQNAFLSQLLAAELGKGKSGNSVEEIIGVMVRLKHPGAADALVGAYEKFILKAKGHTYDYWYYRVIPLLSKDDIPKLEAVVPKLKDRQLDQWVEAIQELQNRT